MLGLVACGAPAVVRPGEGTYARSPCGGGGPPYQLTKEERVLAVGFLDRLLRAAVPGGVFLDDAERRELEDSGEMPVLFWADVTFTIPPGLRAFRQSGAGSEGIAATAAASEDSVAYLEVQVDLRKRGAFVFDRSLGHALPDGALEGTRSLYCVAERREGWLRRRTVFLYWVDPAGDYHQAP